MSAMAKKFCLKFLQPGMLRMGWYSVPFGVPEDQVRVGTIVEKSGAPLLSLLSLAWKQRGPLVHKRDC